MRVRERWLLGAIPFALLFGLWCTLSFGGFVRALFLPTPTAVISEGIRLFSEEGFHHDVLLSLARVFTGFVVSAVLAFPLGVLIGSSPRVEASLAPVIAFLRYVPATAFIPIAILWFGVGFVENVVLVFISIFFYLVLLIADAAVNVRRSLIDTALTLGASPYQVLSSVVVRSALPDIWNAMRTMFGVGWTMIVVVELVGAESGIGAKIIHAQRFLQTPKIVAGIVVIGILGIACDLTFRGLHRVLFPWAHD
jgi:NitT/TauT family transport system permease protein